MIACVHIVFDDADIRVLRIRKAPHRPDAIVDIRNAVIRFGATQALTHQLNAEALNKSGPDVRSHTGAAHGAQRIVAVV